MADDEGVPFELYVLTFNHFFFDGVFSNKPIHIHPLRLPDPVRAIHGLKIELRVPIAVIKDHGIRRSEIDPEPACSG